jgi:hypothetical protein
MIRISILTLLSNYFKYYGDEHIREILKFIPDELRSNDLYVLFHKHGLAVRHIPDELITREMCDIKHKCYRYEEVPIRYRSDDLLIEFVNTNGDVPYDEIKDRDIEFKRKIYTLAVSTGKWCLKIPEDIYTKELSELAFSKDDLYFYDIPEKFKTIQMYEDLMKSSTLYLEHIPKRIRTEIMSFNAVKCDGLSLQNVSRIHKTRKVCQAAIENNFEALKYFPKQMLTKKWYLRAVKCNHRAMRLIPIEMITEEICIAAMEKSSLAWRLIPQSMKTDKVMKYEPESERKRTSTYSERCKMYGKF